MASEEEFTSDSLDTTEIDLPEDVLGYVRDQVVDYIKKTEFSAKIQHTQGQSPKLVLSFGNLRGNKDNHKISCWFEIRQDPTIRTLSFGKIPIDLLWETCCDPNRNRKSTDQEAKQTHKSSGTKNTNTILVENVPPTADEDLLEMFFESTKKYGGGPVTEVRIIRDINIAYVTFCEASAVEKVMKKKPIMFGTTELAVKPYKNLLPANETITRVDVMGLLVSKEFTEGLLKELFYLFTVPTYGPELAALMKVGTRVVRGKDWKWDEQDGGGKGHVIGNRPGLLTGFIRVKWDNGIIKDYRMGAENCYDLQIAPKE